MKNLVFLIFVVLITAACQVCKTSISYSIPDQLDDGIAVKNAAEAQMDTSKISQALNMINCGRFGEVHSMLVYKNKALIVEEYFQGHKYKWDARKYHGEMVQWDSEMRHSIMSCTKSFTSACIGIAVDKGFIKDVNQSIFDYLPDHQHLKTNNREFITIEHLLTMTSGLAWNEWGAAHGTSANDIDRLYIECSDDPVKCVLEREWKAEPGEFFTYNGGGLIILGEILKNATNLDENEFSKEYLFGPLGIDTAEWYQFDNGAFASDGSLKITPRDMLKFGITYLNEGLWNGERIISADWVEKSSNIYKNNARINIPIEDTGKNDYGYTWWLNDISHKGEKINLYRAGGWGGQTIMVIPEMEMVVVFTGGNYAARSHLFKILKKYVL